LISNKKNHANLALKINDLSHFYDNKCALKDISLSLPMGATLGLIGPDGVGKSTLLSLISGIKLIQSGSIYALNRDLGNPLERMRVQSDIAFMPQGLGRKIYPTLSVYENVDFCARLHNVSYELRTHRINELLKATGLLQFNSRKAQQLSGGMKQKLALCCSLVQAPKILILDEPTTGIDPLSRRQFWDLVDLMRSENNLLTIIVATSNMEEAKQFDYLTALDDGVQLTTGKTSKILEEAGAKSPEEAYIALLPDHRRLRTSPGLYTVYNHSNQDIVIQATNLTKRYDAFVAVDNVSFSIYEGEIFGFLGPNGCGKTTTIKMLTGLIDPTVGETKLLSKNLTAGDLNTRFLIGYMSQNFSLYEELTIEENLRLHAGIYDLCSYDSLDLLVESSMETFDLSEFSTYLPKNVPLGIRQRLQLAVACLHKPKILVLDEPTSGVDPLARELFWRHLYRLSRDEKVTIFITTHFMNEAERCDRVSLMNHGKILSIGSPAQICKSRNSYDLDEAFISFLNEESIGSKIEESDKIDDRLLAFKILSRIDFMVEKFAVGFSTSIAGAWAITRREFIELSHDRHRLAFAIFGPVFLLIVASLCVSFDLQKVHYAIVDRDQTYSSRKFIEYFSGNPYMISEDLLWQDTNLIYPVNKLRQLVLEIPENYGKDLARGATPEIGLYIDGSVPLTSSSILALSNGIIAQYQQSFAASRIADSLYMPLTFESHYMFNQEFKSIIAITPGALVLSLYIIPAMMTALAIVREKEIGTILNFYSAQMSTLVFLVGKQIPYMILSMISFLIELFIITLFFDLPIQGSIIGLFIGFILFSFSSTAFGLLISVLVSSQVSAIFGAAIVCLIIAINFSGFLFPVSVLTGYLYLISMTFPSTWFQFITVGSLVKAQTFRELVLMYPTIVISGAFYLFLSCSVLKKQDL
jgi:ribosome-dependent ATPase